MDETDAPAPAPRSIGERLRAGRERSGLSAAAAAEKLHLDIKVIEALEADRFAELGASVYVRGHLRRYADFVGEPGAELVQAYTAKQAQPPPPDLTQVPQAERRADPRQLISPLVALGGALVLALAIWWVLATPRTGGSAASAPEARATRAESTESVSPAPAAGAVVPTVAPAPGARVADSKPAVTNPAGSNTTPATPAATPPREEAPPRNTRLTLELNSESWVEVYDSRGERLFYDVASAGSVQAIEGRPPLRVVLGNAGAVAVQVDGQPREIPASALNGEGARFVVNRSGSLARSRQ